jgi:outer membrane protein assembly factor BamB
MGFWRIGDEKAALKDEEDKTCIQVTGQPYTHDDILICATYGHIYAVRKIDGSEIWDTKFPTGVLGGIISIFITDTDKLIVGGLGKTVCMNLLTGQTIWINKMVVSMKCLLFTLKYTNIALKGIWI